MNRRRRWQIAVEKVYNYPHKKKRPTETRFLWDVSILETKDFISILFVLVMLQWKVLFHGILDIVPSLRPC
ncbi:MAG: hypothetical protein PHW19_09370, partial [Salinivirgaceae bacterium]|nr:hypothetical protein [Salinivirgaceae bacterium]